MKPGLRLSDFFVILLLIGLPAAVFAQKPEAVASIDSNNILIGDQVKYSYKFTFPSAATPLMPVIADTLTKEVEVVSRTKMDTAVSADKKFTTFSQTLYISSFDSGTFVIPPMVFSYRQANDTTTYYASTNPIMLYVNTVSVDTTKEFHSGLTDILRTYMEGQFQVEAMEMITSDVIASLKAAQLPQEEINRMEKILTLADMVKFAKFNPLPDEHDQSLKNGVLFVENTRPKASATAQAGTTIEPNSQKPQEEPKTE